MAETPTTGIKFPELKTSGVYLRSQRLKLPPSVGQKKSKAIESMLTELGLGDHPSFSSSFNIYLMTINSDDNFLC